MAKITPERHHDHNSVLQAGKRFRQRMMSCDVGVTRNAESNHLVNAQRATHTSLAGATCKLPQARANRMCKLPAASSTQNSAQGAGMGMPDMCPALQTASCGAA